MALSDQVNTQSIRRAPMPTTVQPQPMQPIQRGGPVLAGNPNQPQQQQIPVADPGADWLKANEGIKNSNPDLYYQLLGKYSQQINNYNKDNSQTAYANYAGSMYQRPGANPNAPWASGGVNPVAGVDVRPWQNVNNPNAYLYGGRPGGANDEANRYAQMGAWSAENGAPQIDLNGAYTGQMEQEGLSRNAQARGLEMLEKSALGQGTSVAAAQLQGGLAQSMRNQLQVAASGRGGGASLVAAGQNAAAQNAQMSSAANFQGAQLRAQEIANAQNNFSQQATQIRANDLQRAGMSAQLATQQAQLEAQQHGLNQQGQLAYEAMRQGVFNTQLSAQQSGEAQNSGVGLANAQQRFQQEQADNAFQRQLIGGALTAVGTIGGAVVGGPAGAAGGAALGGAAANGINSSQQSNQGGPSNRYLT